MRRVELREKAKTKKGSKEHLRTEKNLEFRKATFRKQ